MRCLSILEYFVLNVLHPRLQILNCNRMFRKYMVLVGIAFFLFFLQFVKTTYKIVNLIHKCTILLCFWQLSWNKCCNTNYATYDTYATCDYWEWVQYYIASIILTICMLHYASVSVYVIFIVLSAVFVTGVPRLLIVPR